MVATRAARGWVATFLLYYYSGEGNCKEGLVRRSATIIVAMKRIPHLL